MASYQRARKLLISVNTRRRSTVSRHHARVLTGEAASMG
jgi:hypothetical protein